MQLIPSKSLFPALTSLLSNTVHLHLDFKVNIFLQNSFPARCYCVCSFCIRNLGSSLIFLSILSRLFIPISLYPSCYLPVSYLPRCPGLLYLAGPMQMTSSGHHSTKSHRHLQSITKLSVTTPRPTVIPNEVPHSQ